MREWPHWLERYAWRPYDGGHGFVGIRLRESQQLKEGVLNSCTQLLPYQYYPWSFSPAISAWRKFAGRARAWFGYERSSDGRSRQSGNDLADNNTLSIIATYPNRDPSGAQIETAWQAFVSMPELLRLVVLRLMHHLNPRVPMIGLVNFVEMEPRPENRITLTDDRDALDIPVPRVVHEMSQRDLESLQRLHEQIATDLKTMGCEGEVVGTRLKATRQSESGVDALPLPWHHPDGHRPGTIRSELGPPSAYSQTTFTLPAAPSSQRAVVPIQP